ncbi:unnamed protein product [Peronospora destructor]|uniref:Uncharacterized protein n=1 Tax=Peronospora destructor TaxID=86335 RepID=A0AAV0VCB4_9STRA|nr:unnamed protein product [Peronospora destructor]
MNANGRMFSQVLLQLVMGTLASTLASETNDFCSSVTSCLKDGSVTCNTTVGDCPPCIYALNNTFTCWKKDNSTNTCPFTGVRYDCSDSWRSTTSTTSSSSATNLFSTDSVGSTPASTLVSSSVDTKADNLSSVTIGGISTSLITYGAISLGAFLALVILIILCARRRKMRRFREANIATEAGNINSSDRRLRGLSKPRDDASAGPYNNVLDTTKINFAIPNITSSHKELRCGPIVSHLPTNESPRSFNGMLADSSDFPAVLGNKAGPYKSDGRSAHGTSVAGGISRYSNVSEYVQPGRILPLYIHSRRLCITSLSDMSFSESISDLNCSQFSLESSQNTGRLPQRRTNQDKRFSLNDSFYRLHRQFGHRLRVCRAIACARRERDCFSEMSYNDERYSFSSLNGLDDSQGREGKRGRVEI